jgi:zinc finger protein
MSNNLFPTLGDIATRTDALKEVDDNDARLAEDAPGQFEQEEGEEKEMQEIESMCMRCHDNVCLCILLLQLVRTVEQKAAGDYHGDQHGRREHMSN